MATDGYRAANGALGAPILKTKTDGTDLGVSNYDQMYFIFDRNNFISPSFIISQTGRFPRGKTGFAGWNTMNTHY